MENLSRCTTEAVKTVSLLVLSVRHLADSCRHDACHLVCVNRFSRETTLLVMSHSDLLGFAGNCSAGPKEKGMGFQEALVCRGRNCIT